MGDEGKGRRGEGEDRKGRGGIGNGDKRRREDGREGVLPGKKKSRRLWLTGLRSIEN